jgi:hypothetical protein
MWLKVRGSASVAAGTSLAASVSVASVGFGGIGSLVGIRVRVRVRVRVNISDAPNLVGDRVSVRALAWAGLRL